MIDVKIKVTEGACIPAYATEEASCMDLHAFLQEPVRLYRNSFLVIPTGIFVELPTGYEFQIRPRSGLAFNNNITIMNSPGTIDSDYRGEIKIGLFNHGSESIDIKDGDRIAQMALMDVPKVNWIRTDVLSETKRGAGGFGHTGTGEIPSFLEGHINNQRK